MEGTVKIGPNGDYVAKQVWLDVQKIISYSSGLMSELFSTLRVTKDEQSPFCQDFTSLNDFRDEFIRYMPNTFKYDDVQGTGDQGAEEVSDSSEVEILDHCTEDAML